MFKKILGYTVIGLGIGFIVWYLFIAVKPVEIPQEEIIASYQYQPVNTENFKLQELDSNSYKLSFRSFDGSIVNGQISFPQSCIAKCPVLLGVSAMGRNYNRWWIDSWKGRATVTSVNKLGEVALQNGYALVAIDARYHGSRKSPDKTLRSIMNDLHFFGDKSSYEKMILNTVKDYRVLIDWLSNHERIDKESIVMAGYSMGGQISLLAASVDSRISRIVSIVPPYLDDKVALAAPKNLVSLITSPQVLLITSDDDENASVAENLSLFNLIASAEKSHLVLEGGHILPANYVKSVESWLVEDSQD